MGNSLHIGNLSASVTEADLLDLFGKIGPVELARIITNTETGLSRGSAFVRMTNATDAATAISRLNFTQYDGRVMSVSEERRANSNHQ